MNSRATGWIKLKIFIVVEFICVLIALILPITPKKGSGNLLDLPPDVASYFQSVVVGFVMGNGVLVAIAVTAGIYWFIKGRPPLTTNETTEESSPLDS